MSEKFNKYKAHLRSMQEFCLKEAKQTDFAPDHWKSLAKVWAMAEKSMDAYFDKEDFED